MGRSPQSPVGAVRRIALHSPWQHEVMVMLPDHHHHEAGRAKPSSLLIQQYSAPPQWAGRWRPSGRLGLAARPDQVVRAVLSFDQAGIDRGRERRIVEGHGDVLPPGLAGLLPRRADVVAGGLQAEVRGLLVVPLSLGTSLTLTLSVRVRSVPVKPSLSAVKVPMLAMMKLLWWNKVRAHRVLVVIRPAGTGGLHRLRSQRSGEPGGEKNLSREECAERSDKAGKLFSPDGCSHEARGAAAPPLGFTTTQGRLGPNRIERRQGRLGIPARRQHRLAH